MYVHRCIYIFYTVLWLLYVKVKVSERFSQTVYGCMWRTVKVDFFPEVLLVWGNHCSEDSIHCHELATEETVSLEVNIEAFYWVTHHYAILCPCSILTLHVPFYLGALMYG